MTCIVAVEHNGVIYMGGDSAGVGGLSLTVRDDKKVFKNGEMVFGFTSSFRMGQLLEFKLDLPYHKPKISDYKYMVTEFIDAVRSCLKDGGYARNTSGEESGGTFLVGYRGTVYRIDGDFQVGMPTDPYSAVGCGDDLALGSLYSTRARETDPMQRVMEALEAAERFSAGVRRPFNIVSTEAKTDGENNDMRDVSEDRPVQDKEA